MLDVEYLNELIDSKGIKRSFIAEQLKISPAAFYNKSHGKTEFTFKEAQILFDVLGVNTKAEQQKIFLLM